MAIDEIPALAIEQTNSFVSPLATIIPHRLVTTPFSRYISQKAGIIPQSEAIWGWGLSGTEGQHLSAPQGSLFKGGSMEVGGAS